MSLSIEAKGHWTSSITLYHIPLGQELTVLGARLAGQQISVVLLSLPCLPPPALGLQAWVATLSFFLRYFLLIFGKLCGCIQCILIMPISHSPLLTLLWVPNICPSLNLKSFLSHLSSFSTGHMCMCLVSFTREWTTCQGSHFEEKWTSLRSHQLSIAPREQSILCPFSSLIGVLAGSVLYRSYSGNHSCPHQLFYMGAGVWNWFLMLAQ